MLINAILKNQIFILTLLLMFLAEGLLLCQECTKKKKTLVNKNPKISKAERSIFSNPENHSLNHISRVQISEILKLISTFLHLTLPLL